MYVPSIESTSTISSASEEEHPEMYFSERLNEHCPISKISHTASLRSVMSSKCIDFKKQGLLHSDSTIIMQKHNTCNLFCRISKCTLFCCNVGSNGMVDIGVYHKLSVGTCR